MKQPINKIWSEFDDVANCYATEKEGLVEIGDSIVECWLEGSISNKKMQRGLDQITNEMIELEKNRQHDLTI